MNSIPYVQIRDQKYAQFFEEERYADKEMSDKEKDGLISYLNELIDEYSQGLPFIISERERLKDLKDGVHCLNNTIYSIALFVLITIIDSVVATKYFTLADKEYDRRFMRGKLRVILNEGFKRLYGFDEKTKTKSEWHKLEPLMSYFPEIIKSQYAELSQLLDKHATSSTWWRDARNVETHLDAEKLYESRNESIAEYRVYADTMKLFNTLSSVLLFLTNINGCILNSTLKMDERGDVK